MNVINSIKNYTPYNEQEKKDKDLILNALLHEKNIFTRENALAHMTASAWVVNQDKTKVLMVWHNIFQSWSWLGGHADGDEDLLHVALKEVKEESGLVHVTPLSTEIFSLESLTVNGHIKNGAYVSSHLHLNVTYLLEANDQEPLKSKLDENRGVRWFPLDEAIAVSTEPFFQERVYAKLNKKLRETYNLISKSKER
jgi:8-oxo-dGTP pyrophosphatase MutT (NUDIX family)